MEKGILVTGAGGFIGSHLARKLHQEGHFVRAVDVKWDGYFEGAYCSERFTLDLRKYETCLQATRCADQVYHLAADMGGIDYITEVIADIMYNSGLMNMNMLQASVQNNVNRFFFSSSACVYREHKQLAPDVIALKEADAVPAQPDTYYGWEKLFMEELCGAYSTGYDLDTRIGRYHNICGPYGTYKGGKEKAPAALCRKEVEASDSGKIEIWGDGKQTRSFCYIDDCVRGTIMLVESNHAEPLNIGSDRLVTIDGLADVIIEVSGKRITKKHDLSAPQGVRGRNADPSLVEKALGWEPEISLEQGPERTYKWIRNVMRRDEA